MKRKKPTHIVEPFVMGVAQIAAILLAADGFGPLSMCVEKAIALIDEAQRQVDKDHEKGAEKSGL